METATLRILSSSRAIWGSVCFILLLHTARPSAHREAFCTPRGLLHTARRTVLSVPCTPQTDREIVPSAPQSSADRRLGCRDCQDDAAHSPGDNLQRDRTLSAESLP